jgi:uncharacterized membrane protein YGL010W
MQSLNQQFTDYCEQHSNPLNKLLHYIGVPCIIVGALMLLNWVAIDIATVWRIGFSWFLVIGAAVYYYFLNVRLAILTFLILLIVTWISTAIAGARPSTFSFILFLLLFIGGWIVLLAGHLIEKSKPAFTKNIQQLAIAPLFILIDALTALKLEKYFGVETKIKPKA